MPLMGNTALGDEVTCPFRFDSYNSERAWETNPEYMVDGNITSFATTTIIDEAQHLDENRYDHANMSYNYTITKVCIQAYGYWSGNQHNIFLQPFRGNESGRIHIWTPPEGPPDGYNESYWSERFDITADFPTLREWTWEDIESLDCLVIAGDGIGSFTVGVSYVWILVSFIVP